MFFNFVSKLTVTEMIQMLYFACPWFDFAQIWIENKPQICLSHRYKYMYVNIEKLLIFEFLT